MLLQGTHLLQKILVQTPRTQGAYQHRTQDLQLETLNQDFLEFTISAIPRWEQTHKN